jgi:5-methylthioadenosine/S-adenosylhomocysteine deaminase
MESVDCLLTNALVLTMDEQFNQYEPGAVAVSGDSIAAVGPEAEVRETYTSERVIDCDGKVLMPGLVNTHTHVPMTLLRGLADDLRLDVWLLGYMMPVEREFVSPEFVRLGAQLACAEMIRSGTTCFADMYYFEEAIAEATAEAGMRAICAQSVLKFPAPDASSYEDALETARDYIQRWKGHPLIVPGIAPHAPYTCTEEILRAAAALAVEFDVPLKIHLSETTQEVENIRSETGMPVIPYIRQFNLLDAKVIGGHCVHVDEGEMRVMQKTGMGVAHNPTSNMKLTSGIAPIKRMIELGVNVGIGTDGPASNNDLDMFEEMRLATLLAKVSTGDPTALPAKTIVLMATRMGAQAAHVGDITGSLEVGKRADLILVAIDPLHNTPRFRRDPNSPYSQLVYAAKATDVTDVMINGAWVMRDRRLLTLDEGELLDQSRAYAQKIDAFLSERERSPLSKMIAIGGAREEESFEAQVKVPVSSIGPILAALQKPEIEILRKLRYQEYDTYLCFNDPELGDIRFREDHFLEEEGQVPQVLYKLTYIGKPTKLKPRNRFGAFANQSLRFYREYFEPDRVLEMEKERLRYKVRYQDTEFFINIDTIQRPDLGCFLEVNSRTWVRGEIEERSRLVNELIQFLGASPENATPIEYVQMLETM